METVEIIKEKKNTEPQTRNVSGSVALLEILIAEKVETVFGYPGGAIMPLYDALYDYNEKIKHNFPLSAAADSL